MKTATLTALTLMAFSTTAGASIDSADSARLSASARIVQEMRGSISQDLWEKARCVGVVPDLKKAAFIIGGEYGSGVMSCRAGDRWSPPVFVQLAKGSWGFQAGAEQVDLVMLVMNESGVQKMLANTVALGADASIAAGPVGRQGHVGTDAALTTEILAYSRARGLFAGIDLSGGVLRTDEDANRRVYGSAATARSILASREIAAPPSAAPFLSTLNAASSPSSSSSAVNATTSPSSSASQTPARPVRTPPPTTDSDLRARLVDMQQTIAQMMSDSDQRSVGTSGRGESPTRTTVNRAQLEQLRHEVEAALAALNDR